MRRSSFVFTSKISFWDAKIVINNPDVKRVQVTKFYGVIIDEKLTWKYHSAHISGKINKNISVIYKIIVSSLYKFTALCRYFHPTGGWTYYFCFIRRSASAVRRQAWFPVISRKGIHPIFTKFGMGVYWVKITL